MTVWTVEMVGKGTQIFVVAVAPAVDVLAVCVVLDCGFCYSVLKRIFD